MQSAAPALVDASSELGPPGVEACRDKRDVDIAICGHEDRVVVLRFGRYGDPMVAKLDKILEACAPALHRMAALFTVDMDEVPEYARYFDVTHTPACVFFVNAVHMKMDSGTPDHSKFVGVFTEKQDLIDVVETIYRGAMHGKHIVPCPLPPERVPRFELLLGGV